MTDLIDGAARLGLGARATIYVLMGLVAAQVALGDSKQEADQRGALASVAQHPGGEVLLVLLAVGFFGYALWRFSQAAFGVVGKGKDVWPRIAALARGLVYGSVGITTVKLLAGSSAGSQDQKQQGLTARALSHSGGRWLVGAVGLAVVGAGLGMAVRGLLKKFEKQLRVREMSASTRTVVVRLGMIGTAARGLVIALAGGLVVDAAVRQQPDKARGLDGALRTLADQPYGTVLLLLAAAGLVVFGLFGFAQARWRRT